MGAKARERSDGEGGGCGRSPTVGRFFENLCMKTTFLAHWMALLGGWLCEVTYTNSLLSLLLKNYFTPIKGAGAWPLVPLAICQWRWCSQDLSMGAKQGSEVTERGEGVGGFFFTTPTVGRFFENLCMKTTFLAHYMAVLGGWLCEVTYTNPLLPFLLKNYFTPIKGAGAWPLVPLAMPVTVVQPGFVNGGPKRGRFFKICVWKRHFLAH